MTCPDWTRLAAHRLADPAATPLRDDRRDEPEGWEAALGHLDGCPECRRRALAADPTLLFRSLPDWEPDTASEVDAMRAGVAALRRAHRVDAEASPQTVPGGPTRSDREAGRWRAAAVAAILAAALLSAAPAMRHTPGEASRPGVAAGLAAPVAYLDDATFSTVDEIENPTASVYHFDDEEVGVVMVVDAGLDV